MRNAAAVLIALLTAASGPARIITVDDDGPADFNNIQAAINYSNNGDTILVADGTYLGNGNRDIDFKGKAITLRSENGAENCIINCEGTEMEFHRGFYFHSGEDRDSVLDGFTIINGFSFSGGGIFCEGSSPTISNNIIRNNITAYDYEGGGGISCWSGASPSIMNNIITENASADLSGGGIYCYEAGSPIIANNIITGNYALYGGGIGCVWSVSPLIMNNIIVGNTGGYSSGGIYCWGGLATIMNNIIAGNTAKYGGGIYCSSSSPTITNNTIVGNMARAEGGGIWCWKDSSPTVTNCIFWGNAAPKGPQVALRSNLYYGPSGLTVNYSDLAGGQAHMYIEEGCTLNWGLYNIDADPYFAKIGYRDPNGTPGEAADDFWVDGDYRLKSQGGRWDANEGRWTRDEVTSPCIDAGDPMGPIGYEPFPNGGIINMGAYGGTAEASTSYFGEPVCETIVAGDIDGDCNVNFKDFAIMAAYWLEDNRL